MAEAMKKAGAPVDMVMIPGANHGWIGKTPDDTRRYSLLALDQTFAFLDRIAGVKNPKLRTPARARTLSNDENEPHHLLRGRFMTVRRDVESGSLAGCRLRGCHEGTDISHGLSPPPREQHQAPNIVQCSVQESDVARSIRDGVEDSGMIPPARSTDSSSAVSISARAVNRSTVCHGDGCDQDRCARCQRVGGRADFDSVLWAERQRRGVAIAGRRSGRIPILTRLERWIRSSCWPARRGRQAGLRPWRPSRATIPCRSARPRRSPPAGPFRRSGRPRATAAMPGHRFP